MREPTPEQYPHALTRYFFATRPAFLSISVVAVLLGIASAHAGGVAISWPLAGLTLLLALLAHAGANVVNDYHDARSGADAANQQRLFPFTGGSRFIQNGVLEEARVARLGHALLALALLGGLWLVVLRGPDLIWLGAAGLFLAWAYSAPPLRLMTRGLGEGVILLAWLLLVVGADYVQRGAFAALPWQAGFSFALLVAALLYLNQFPDHAGDAASGKRTLVVRLGPQQAKLGYLALVLLAYAWLVLMVERDALPQAAAAAALTLIFSFRAAQDLRAHAEEPAELLPAIRYTLLAAHLHGGALALGLFFAT